VHGRAAKHSRCGQIKLVQSSDSAIASTGQRLIVDAGLRDPGPTTWLDGSGELIDAASASRAVAMHAVRLDGEYQLLISVVSVAVLTCSGKALALAAG